MSVWAMWRKFDQDTYLVGLYATKAKAEDERRIILDDAWSIGLSVDAVDYPISEEPVGE